VIYRELIPSDTVPEGVPSGGFPIEPDKGLTVVAVNDSGEIVALLRAFYVVQMDPLWVREDHRGNGKVLPHLWDAMKAKLVERGVSGVEVGMLDHNPGPQFESVVARLCEFAGGEEIRGRLFLVPVA
jgi:hypothetical protein